MVAGMTQQRVFRRYCAGCLVVGNDWLELCPSDRLIKRLIKFSGSREFVAGPAGAEASTGVRDIDGQTFAR